MNRQNVVLFNHRRGFTLIELLVVISIISVLIALLMPALGSARKAAQNLRCQTNIRSITQASINYSVDAKGNLPPRYVPDLNFGIVGMFLYVLNVEPYYVKAGPAPYTKNSPNPAWSCPTALTMAGINGDNRYLTHYVPNTSLSGRRGVLTPAQQLIAPLEREFTRIGMSQKSLYEERYPRLDQIHDESKTVLYGESTARTFNTTGLNGHSQTEFTTFTEINAANYDINPIPVGGLYGNTSTPGYHHGSGQITVSATARYRPEAWGNFAWADGHVSSIKPVDAKDAWLVRGNHALKK